MWWAWVLDGSGPALLTSQTPLPLVQAASACLEIALQNRLQNRRALRAGLDKALCVGVPAAWLVEWSFQEGLELLQSEVVQRFGASLAGWARSTPPPFVSSADNDDAHIASLRWKSMADDKNIGDALENLLNHCRTRIAVQPTLGAQLMQGSNAPSFVSHMLRLGWDPRFPLSTTLGIEKPFMELCDTPWTPLALATAAETWGAWELLWEDPRVRTDSMSRDQALLCCSLLMENGKTSQSVFSKVILLLEHEASPSRLFSFRKGWFRSEEPTFRAAGEFLANTFSRGTGSSLYKDRWKTVAPYMEGCVWPPPQVGGWDPVEDRLRAAQTQPSIIDQDAYAALLVLASRPGLDEERLAQFAFQAATPENEGWPLRWIKERFSRPWTLNSLIAAAEDVMDSPSNHFEILPGLHWAQGLSDDEQPFWRSIVPSLTEAFENLALLRAIASTPAEALMAARSQCCLVLNLAPVPAKPFSRRRL